MLGGSEILSPSELVKIAPSDFLFCSEILLADFVLGGSEILSPSESVEIADFVQF